MTQGMKKNSSTLLQHLQDIPIHIPKYYLPTPLNVDGVQVTSLIIMTENIIVRPLYDPWRQNKNSLSLLHTFKTCLIIYWSFNCLLLRIKMSFFDLHLTPRDKMKFRSLIAHLQDIPNDIPEYHL